MEPRPAPSVDAFTAASAAARSNAMLPACTAIMDDAVKCMLLECTDAWCFQEHHIL